MNTALRKQLEDPAWHGWCSPEKGDKLTDEILRTDVHTAVEIGTYSGRSACVMGLAFKEKGGGHVFTCDPYDNEEATRFQEPGENKAWWGRLGFAPIAQQARAKLEEWGLAQWVTVEPTTSVALWNNYPDLTPDLVHIDGDHSEPMSTLDVALWVPRLRKGGILFMDDEEWDTTAVARSLIRKWCKPLYKIKVGTCVCGVYQKR